MGKYLDTQRERAKQVLKQVYKTDPVDDPLLDLICLNLQDDPGEYGTATGGTGTNRLPNGPLHPGV